MSIPVRLPTSGSRAIAPDQAEIPDTGDVATRISPELEPGTEYVVNPEDPTQKLYVNHDTGKFTFQFVDEDNVLKTRELTAKQANDLLAGWIPDEVNRGEQMAGLQAPARRASAAPAAYASQGGGGGVSRQASAGESGGLNSHHGGEGRVGRKTANPSQVQRYPQYAMNTPDTMSDVDPDFGSFKNPLPAGANMPITTSPFTGGVRANLMHGPLPGKNEIVSINAGGINVSVNRQSAPYFKGFLDDLRAAGAPLHDVGGYNVRNIAGTHRMSQHAYGNALDVNQSARNVVSSDFRHWANSHQSELNAALNKNHIINGGNWRSPDFGHFEWNGVSDERSNVAQTANHISQRNFVKGGGEEIADGSYVSPHSTPSQRFSKRHHAVRPS